jgi:hypothetical protein
MHKYKLTHELPACTEDEINRTFDYMDEWKENLEEPFTIDMLHEVFPQYSSGECQVIFESWENAQQSTPPPES